MKQQISETIQKIEVDGPLKDTIRDLLALQDEYSVLGYTDLAIAYDYYGYDGAFIINLIGKRFETDKEYKIRCDIEEKEACKKAATRAAKEKREKKEYERLRKKYENN